MPRWPIPLVLLLALPVRGEAPHTDRYGDPLPDGALARLGTVRLRPATSYASFALSPDGKLLASGEEGKVRLWDLTPRGEGNASVPLRPSGKQLRSFDLSARMRVTGIRFSPEGKLFAARSVQIIFNRGVWVSSSLYVGRVAGGEVFRWKEPKPVVLDGLHFLHGGKVLVGRVRRLKEPSSDVVFWDAASGKVVRKFPGAEVHALSSDGKILATARDTTITLWDAAGGKELRRFRGHRDPVRCLAFSPDGKLLASGAGPFDPLLGEPEPEEGKKKAEPGETVRLWDVSGGGQRACLKGHTRTVFSLAFTPDGRTLVSEDWSDFLLGSEEPADSLLLWDVTAGRLRHRFDRSGAAPPSAGPGWGWAFSPDGKTLVWAPGDDTLREWDVAAGKERRRRDVGAWISRLEYSSDGRVLLATGEGARLWDAAGGKALHAYPAHHTAVTGMTFSPDGRTLLSRDDGQKLRLWDVSTGRPLPPFLGPPTHRAQRSGCTPDGKFLAAVGADLVVRRWELPAGRKVREFRVGVAKTLRHWTDTTGAREDDLERTGKLDRCTVVDPRWRTLAVAREDGRIHLWDLATGKEFLRLEGAQGSCGRMAFSPDGRSFLAVCGDGVLRLWALPAGRLLQELKGGEDGFEFFAFSPDGTRLAWGSGERIRLHDLIRGKEVGHLAGHPGRTECVAFDRDGRTLVSGGLDETLRLWDAPSGSELRAFDGLRPRRLDRTPDGRVLAVLAVDRIYDTYALREALTGRLLLGEVKRGEVVAFSSDGTTLAIVRSARPPDLGLSPPGREVEFREVATGGLVGRMTAGHRGGVTALAFSPDGRTLATGSSDTTILLWDWLRACRPDGGARRPTELWGDLASADARAAYAAIGALADRPEEAVALLKQRVRPVSEEECRPVRRLLAELDDDHFAVREKASAGLRRLSAEWLPLVYATLAGRPPLEVRRRLAALLAEPTFGRRWSPEMLRRLRAVRVLERVGTPEARKLLERLAGGAVEAPLTREAKAALGRLDRRAAAKR